ncbi:MAG TPA: hypothetical protein VM187_18670 [Niastella sp.]|nr:hypothetical protein [Niastella sp.]
MKYTPDDIQSLKHNEIFVYGSNQYARHGAGAAATAVRLFGAMFGECPAGLLGSSYGIITTSFNGTPVTIDMVKKQVAALYDFAHMRPDLTFYVTKIGCGLAGFSVEQMANVFIDLALTKPINIILPKEFTI